MRKGTDVKARSGMATRVVLAGLILNAAGLAGASPTDAAPIADRPMQAPEDKVSTDHLGQPAMSSQYVVRQCDRVISLTVVADREGDVLRRVRAVRFRDRHCG